VVCTIMTVGTTNRHDNSVCPYSPIFFLNPCSAFFLFLVVFFINGSFLTLMLVP
jgi:hypothetical protein